jgi:putative ABC transport system substrate-binding protein
VAGEIALKSPEPDAVKAEAYFERALAIARAQQAKSWELRDEIEGVLGKLQRARPDGVLVGPDYLLLTKRTEIAAALATSQLPAVYPFREYAAVGGLMIYGSNLGVLSERAAGYVDKILKGAKPSDLPVQLATEFELIINLNTAAQIGVTIPPTLIARADEVIE